jgi:hypothetical protein
MTHSEFNSEPPQNCQKFSFSPTIHGQLCGIASCPPTILEAAPDAKFPLHRVPFGMCPPLSIGVVMVVDAAVVVACDDAVVAAVVVGTCVVVVATLPPQSVEVGAPVGRKGGLYS